MIVSNHILTDIINSNHHSPTSARGSVRNQVELVVHINGIHRAKLRNLAKTLLLEMSPHLLQYFREAEMIKCVHK